MRIPKYLNRTRREIDSKNSRKQKTTFSVYLATAEQGRESRIASHSAAALSGTSSRFHPPFLCLYYTDVPPGTASVCVAPVGVDLYSLVIDIASVLETAPSAHSSCLSAAKGIETSNLSKKSLRSIVGMSIRSGKSSDGSKGNGMSLGTPRMSSALLTSSYAQAVK